MDFLSKIVSGNIDRIKRNISNSFVQDLDIQKGFDDELEKGKWNVGDTKVYQGITWEVGGFNAKGAPLWRKAKGGAGGGAASSQNSTVDDNNQNSTNNQSNDKNKTPVKSTQNKSSVNNVSDEDLKKIENRISDLKNDIEKLRKKHLELDAEYRDVESKIKSGNKYTAGWNSSHLDAIKYDYEINKELLSKKKNLLKKLEDLVKNNDDKNNAVKQSTLSVNNSVSKQTQDSTSSKTDSSTQNNSVKNDSNSNSFNDDFVRKNSTSYKRNKVVDKVMSVFDEFGSYYPFDTFSREKVEKIISHDYEEAKKFLSFKFPSPGSPNQFLSHLADTKTYSLQGSDLIFETDKSYNTTSRYAGHLGTITTHYYIYHNGKKIAFSSSSTGSKWGSSPTEAKKECLYAGLINYLSDKYDYDVSK